MPDTLSTSPQDPCPPTDARFARARRRHVDARPGYHHPETEAEKRERYPDDLTHEGFHVGSAAVAYVRRIGEILAAYDADREDKDALHDAVRDLVRFAAWPDFE